jgi:hypothetical protein
MGTLAAGDLLAGKYRLDRPLGGPPGNGGDPPGNGGGRVGWIGGRR